MKRYLYSLMFLAMMLGAVIMTSCNGDDPPIDPPQEYSISLTAENGSAEATLDNEVVTKAAAGTTILLTATPDTGYLFSRWEVVSGDLTPIGNPTQFTMPAKDVEMSAIFVSVNEGIYTITVAAGQGGLAEATVDSESVTQAPEGALITLTATPEVGWSFSGWTVVSGGIEAPEGNPATFNMPASDVEFMAGFSQVDVFSIMDDPNFKAFCEQYDTDGDGILRAEEAQVVTTMTMNGKGLASLAGIEYFTALTRLEAYGNRLTSLDLSGNTALTYVHVNGNQLESIDVMNCPELTYLNVSINKLPELDVTGNTKLVELQAWENPITSIDLSQSVALSILHVGYNRLGEIDVTNCPELTYFVPNGNKMISHTLDLSGNPKLETLYASEMDLWELDTSNNPALTYLDCGPNLISSLDLSGNPELTHLIAGENELSEIDLSNNRKLKNLYVYTNYLTELDLSNTPELVYLDCEENELEVLDISGLTKLTTLACSSNFLTSLDVSNSPGLTLIHCYNCYITSLDVSNLPLLERLVCYNNCLATLDVSTMNYPDAYTLYCGLQTTDGTTPQTLSLTMTDRQKVWWNSVLKGTIFDNLPINYNVVLAE